ncbi:MAG: hypothetical protein B7Z47_04575 [Chthoniobacter sp. 12-60-6]|nr:MAG: hypothetical protein B7Z47_04575 [Chthoniobacter sp. 12-60-6]
MNPNTLKQIEKDIAALAKTLFKQFAKQAEADGKAFLETTKAQTEEWLQELAAGEISEKNFESLVRGERDLAEMTALKQAGLAQVSIDTFTRGVIDIIVNAALAAI